MRNPADYIKRMISQYRTKLISSFGLLIVLTLLSVESINYVHVREELEESSYENMERTMEQMVSNIELRMNEINKLAIRLSGDTEFQLVTANLPNTQFDLFTIIKQRIDFETRNSEVYTVKTYDKDNINQSLDLYQLPINKSDDLRWRRKGVEIAFSDEQNKWSIESYKQKIGREMPVLLFSQPVYRVKTYEVNPIGVLQISMSLEWLFDQLDEMSRKFGGFAITDPNGKVLLASSAAEIGTQFSDQALFREETKQGIRSWTSDNSSVSVKKFANQNWYLASVSPRHAVIAGADTAFKESVLVAGGIFLLAMVLAIVISHSVTRPIKLLRRAMGQMERGTLDAYVAIDSRDEFGYLGKSFNNMAMKIKKLIADNLHTELARREAELIALQAQINPHFLYNALSSIDSLAVSLQEKRIGVISKGLADMFRYSISGDVQSSLQEEIHHVKLYLSIQKIRYNDKLDYLIDIDESLNAYSVPKLLLQPLVENAIGHGLETKVGGGYVNVSAHVSESHMLIEIEDNGIGMTEDQINALFASFETDRIETKTSSRRSIGLQNVYRRIKLFYENDGGMTITSSPGFGTVIQLRIPKREARQDV